MLETIGKALIHLGEKNSRDILTFNWQFRDALTSLLCNKFSASLITLSQLILRQRAPAAGMHAKKKLTYDLQVLKLLQVGGAGYTHGIVFT